MIFFFLLDRVLPFVIYRIAHEPLACRSLGQQRVESHPLARLSPTRDANRLLLSPIEALVCSKSWFEPKKP
jgi:hypothetical protein